jgi:hypothetical protein
VIIPTVIATINIQRFARDVERRQLFVVDATLANPEFTQFQPQLTAEHLGRSHQGFERCAVVRIKQAVVARVVSIISAIRALVMPSFISAASCPNHFLDGGGVFLADALLIEPAFEGRADMGFAFFVMRRSPFNRCRAARFRRRVRCVLLMKACNAINSLS